MWVYRVNLDAHGAQISRFIVAYHEWTAGKKLDALVKDLHGTALARIRENLAGDIPHLATAVHDIALIVKQVSDAERRVHRAMMRLEKTIDSI